MNTATLHACREELEKLALNRYERALQSREIDPADAVRRGVAYNNSILPLWRAVRDAPPPGARPGEVSPENRARIQESRRQMWGPHATDLTSEQLERHRRLHALQAEHALKALGGINDNHPGRGPATSMTGRVMVGDNAGQLFRDFASGDLVNAQLGALPKAQREALGYVEAPQSVDQTIRHAVVEHEGGEKALLRGALETRIPRRLLNWLGLGHGDQDAALPMRPIGGHFGATPILEEKQVIWRDPEAQRIFAGAREAVGGDDARVEALYRQFGGRPDSPIPLGSRRHAELERRVAAMDPEAAPSVITRAYLAPHSMAHGFSQTAAERIMAPAIKKLEELREKAKMIGGVQGRLLEKVVDFLQDRARAKTLDMSRTVVDPADDLALRLMRLRDAVRR